MLANPHSFYKIPVPPLLLTLELELGCFVKLIHKSVLTKHKASIALNRQSLIWEFLEF